MAIETQPVERVVMSGGWAKDYAVQEYDASTGESRPQQRPTEPPPRSGLDGTRTEVEGGWFQVRGDLMDIMYVQPNGRVEVLGHVRTEQEARQALAFRVAADKLSGPNGNWQERSALAYEERTKRVLAEESAALRKAKSSTESARG